VLDQDIERKLKGLEVLLEELHEVELDYKIQEFD